MAKIRVYELARELNLESKVLLAKMKSLGIEVAGHQSTLSAPETERIRKELTDKSEAKPRVVVRRRKKSADSAEELEQVSATASSTAVETQPSGEVASVPAPESPVSVASEPVGAKTLVEEKLGVDDKKVESVPVEPTADQEANAETVDKETTMPSSLGDLEEPVQIVVDEDGSACTPQEEKAAAQSVVSALKTQLQPPEDNKAQSTSSAPSREKDEKPKSSFSGATIVRRATPEESQALSRSRNPQKSERSASGASRGTSQRSDRPAGSRRDTSGSRQPETVFTAKDLLSDSFGYGGIGSKSGDVPRSGQKGKPSSAKEEQGYRKAREREERRPNSRDFLSRATSAEGEEDFFLNSRKKRTVYTPAGGKRRDKKRGKQGATPVVSSTPRAAYRIVKIDGEAISVADLARQLSVKGGELIKKLMDQGIMATLNQTIDYATAEIIAADYGFECKNVERTADDVLGLTKEDDREQLSRPPIVTVMGHVDHGKTSILDAIRESDVAGGESGGITQHIGAYQVDKDGQKITFLDTPGHAAFSAMRARGAQITDIVVLVVAADDGVMPQTKEAISHAKNAGVPLIVAVNKMDKPNINLDRIYTELSELGVMAEDWGGDTQFVKVSALKREGVGDLLDAVLLQSEVLELKSPVTGWASGSIVEAHLDPGRGPVATVMVMKGTLKKGHLMVAGSVTGKVRAMTNERGEFLQQVGPATPVEIIGLSEVPKSGDYVHVVKDEKTAKEAASLVRKEEERRAMESRSSAATLEELLGQVKAADKPQVNIIIKADTGGSVEAIATAVEKLKHEKVKNTVVHKAVGGISESDLQLAETSGAVIFGFNVRAASGCRDLAERKGIVIKYYNVIYELVDTVKSLMAGQLPPVETEIVQGHAEVRNAISVPRVGVVAGSAVIDGKITRSSLLRLIRDEVVIYSGKVGSLRRFKDDVKEVQHGYECGISIDGYSDIREGDVIEAFMVEETAASIQFQAE
ncbi:MAG: translation initiation factor IF-2 [Zetaproteobacteria bacterium]|nr:translation initiation factor IF-2 [Zetaproteobacteria bacterium]